MSRTRYKQVAKKLSWRGTDLWSPTLRDLGSGISVSAAWRPGFGYVLAAVSVTVPAGPRYQSGKLVPVTAKMVPITPRTLDPFFHADLATQLHKLAFKHAADHNHQYEHFPFYSPYQMYLAYSGAACHPNGRLRRPCHPELLGATGFKI